MLEFVAKVKTLMVASFDKDICVGSCVELNDNWTNKVFSKVKGPPQDRRLLTAREIWSQYNESLEIVGVELCLGYGGCWAHPLYVVDGVVGVNPYGIEVPSNIYAMLEIYQRAKKNSVENKISYTDHIFFKDFGEATISLRAA